MTYETFEALILALLLGATGFTIIGCCIIAILDREQRQ